MSFTTTPLRYIPLPRTLPLNTWRLHIIPLQSIATTSYTSVAPIPAAAPSAPSFEVISTVIFIVLIALLLVLTIALLVVPREPSSRQSIAILHMLRTGYGEQELCVNYVYSGVRTILRRAYLELRKAFKCPRCTPRELAQLSRIPAIARFAEVYEDVVYGAKSRQDVNDVLKEVRKL